MFERGEAVLELGVKGLNPFHGEVMVVAGPAFAWNDHTEASVRILMIRLLPDFQ